MRHPTRYSVSWPRRELQWSARMRPPTWYSVSWPRRELHRRPQWRRPHAPPPPSSALRGRMGSSTEAPTGTARMRRPPP
eukprot:3041789-Pyramimonas_sp.AAC.1